MFETGNFWLILTGFFGIGLLLSFTPCVFPMFPILSGIIANGGAAYYQDPRIHSIAGLCDGDGNYLCRRGRGGRAFRRDAVRGYCKMPGYWARSH